jgi:hypothetical protein
VKTGQGFWPALVVAGQTTEPCHPGNTTTPCVASGHVTTCTRIPRAVAACAGFSPVSPCSTNATSTGEPARWLGSAVTHGGRWLGVAPVSQAHQHPHIGDYGLTDACVQPAVCVWRDGGPGRQATRSIRRHCTPVRPIQRRPLHPSRRPGSRPGASSVINVRDGAPTLHSSSRPSLGS